MLEAPGQELGFRVCSTHLKTAINTQLERRVGTKTNLLSTLVTART